jgi:putative DNA primase/helicase
MNVVIDNLHVDITEAKRFLERLDPTTTEFEFRTFDDDKDRKDKNLTKTFYGTLGLHAYELIQLNNHGAGVFVTINATNGTGRKAGDIIRVRAGFVDLDGSPLEPVMQHNLEPHIVVESSPGKWHCYWLIDGLALEDFRAVQEKLIEHFHSDPVVHDLPRIMRLPGFFHHKAAPFRSRIISAHDREQYPASYFGKADQPPHVSGEKHKATALDLWLVGEAASVAILASFNLSGLSHRR